MGTRTYFGDSLESVGVGDGLGSWGADSMAKAGLDGQWTDDAAMALEGSVSTLASAAEVIGCVIDADSGTLSFYTLYSNNRSAISIPITALEHGVTPAVSMAAGVCLDI